MSEKFTLANIDPDHLIKSAKVRTGVYVASDSSDNSSTYSQAVVLPRGDGSCDIAIIEMREKDDASAGSITIENFKETKLFINCSFKDGCKRLNDFKEKQQQIFRAPHPTRIYSLKPGEFLVKKLAG